MRSLIKQKLLFILICSSINWAVYGQVKNILFLGNSYTYYNTLPQLTTDIALSLGDSIYWDSNTPGNTTTQWLGVDQKKLGVPKEPNLFDGKNNGDDILDDLKEPKKN